MKTVLVTGANGQVGSEIRFLSSTTPYLTFVFVDRDELDITSQESVTAFFSQQKFDVLINCAAYTAVDKAESEKETAFKINAEGAGNLAAVCRKNNCSYLHISTDFIFDGTASVPVTESQKPNPLSVYGASKLAGDEIVVKENPGSVILRTSWVYSSYGNNFVKTILKLCKEREGLNIIADQTGTPTYARDLAAAILHIIQQPEWKPGVYNYSNEGTASWYDFAVAIRDLAELKTQINPIETSQYPTPAARPKFSVLNKRKVKETFGLQIPYWRHSLQQCIALINS